MRAFLTQLLLPAAVAVFAVPACAQSDLVTVPSVFSQNLTELQAAYSVEQITQSFSQVESEFGTSGSSDAKRKSPAKAFVLSLILPGAGQYYNGGSILKPLGFLAVEATAWGLYFKNHNEGEDLTDEFEAFNRANWDPERYADYLEFVYGERDDDSISATEISHHLPGTQTQQYFEMTGKYNQFAWGWVDARYNGNDLYTPGFDVPAIVSDATTPESAMRTQYEVMRDKANDKFNAATTMVIVSMANRLISGFEAYLTAKSRNREKSSEFLGRVNVQTRLRSVYSLADTPSMRVSVKF